MTFEHFCAIIILFTIKVTYFLISHNSVNTAHEEKEREEMEMAELRERLSNGAVQYTEEMVKMMESAYFKDCLVKKGISKHKANTIVSRHAIENPVAFIAQAVTDNDAGTIVQMKKAFFRNFLKERGFETIGRRIIGVYPTPECFADNATDGALLCLRCMGPEKLEELKKVVAELGITINT